jgi:predicted RNA-binding Zn ribbon-like protein
MSQVASARGVPLLGGALCLDFANTVSWRGREEPHEWLMSYDDLVEWARRAGVVSDRGARVLRRAARARPADAAAALERAHALREAIYRAFSREGREGVPGRGDLERIGAAYADAIRHASLEAGAEPDRWSWIDEGADLDLVRRAVARSAVELATSAELGRVRECDGDACGWLFVDRSRNASRRWCSSADCGNRARVRRFHERRRGARR